MLIDLRPLLADVPVAAVAAALADAVLVLWYGSGRLLPLILLTVVDRNENTWRKEEELPKE